MLVMILEIEKLPLKSLFFKVGTVKNDGSYGTLLNYSLVQNITCTGAEASVSECTVFQPDSNCLPWCPNGNIGLKCFGKFDNL